MRGAGTEKQRTQFTRAVWRPRNHDYWNVWCVKQSSVYRNIGVLKLICENERTISDTLSDKNMCTDLKRLGEVPGLKRKTGIVFYKVDIWRPHWSKWAYDLFLLEWNYIQSLHWR